MTSFTKCFNFHRNFHNANYFVIRNHIFIKMNITQFRISKIQICLTVIINKNSWINVVPVAFINKRFSNVFKRTCRAV